MSIEYTWIFPALDIVKSVDGYTNVVDVVHWRYAAKDGEYYCDLYGSVRLSPPESPFISFNDLTPETIQRWVESDLGSERIQKMTDSLANEISKKKNQTELIVPPPWS